MIAASAPPASITATAPARPAPGEAQDTAGLTFGELLSDLNPLQYLPVVGTIYRAITGDTIPKPLREAGSLVVSGLLGGPVGVATNVAMLAFEKLTGIDLEDVEQTVLASLSGHSGSQAALPAVAAKSLAQQPAVPNAPAGGSLGWTPEQLAAYGAVRDPAGELHRGGLSSADVLNSLQLASLA